MRCWIARARDGAGSLRLWRPRRPAISIGRLDLRDPRAPEVLELARAAGVPAVKRLAGGRAATLRRRVPVPRLGAAATRGWRSPAAATSCWPRRSSRRSTALGVGASLAEALGEWCPGAWSVQGSSGKLAGLAQRVISGGAWCEALIVIDRDPALTSLARQVHAALGSAVERRRAGRAGRAGCPTPRICTRACARRSWRRWSDGSASAAARAAAAPPSASRARSLAGEHRWE